jgi:hypothetical protein
MPRRAAVVIPDVPLFLIPHILQNGIRIHGEELERVTVKKTFTHVYSMSIRTRSVKRELRPAIPHAKFPAPRSGNRRNPA